MAKARGWWLVAALLAAGSARAQTTAEQQAQQAGDEAQQAAQQTQDAARQAADETGEAARAAGQATEDAARETGQAAQAAGEQAAGTAQGVAVTPDARPLVDRCEALIRGELAGDATLRSQCAAMLRSNGAPVEPGVSREGATAGQSVQAAFTSAGRELVGRGEKAPLGMRRGGPSANMLTTNPVGWFNGIGVNATYSRALERFDKISWVGQARYSRTSGSNGNVTAFGLGGGADYYLMGRNNEGLRIGPRLSTSFGSEDFGGETSFGMVGLSGEIGYNFVATNGLAASAYGGFGGRVAGDDQNEEWEDFTGGEFGPYVGLGLGYAW
jgi:hypothetical protein